MHCEPPQITFIPCEEHFRPVLPTIEGNVDYLSLRGQLTTMDELLQTSGVENEFVRRSLEHWIKTLSESQVEQIELSGEGQSGAIQLEDLVRGKQQRRFQEHSIRALRCSIARTLLVGGYRDFTARLADSPLLQWFCKVGQLDRPPTLRMTATSPGTRPKMSAGSTRGSTQPIIIVFIDGMIFRSAEKRLSAKASLRWVRVSITVTKLCF